jgi:hypothetical protein
MEIARAEARRTKLRTFLLAIALVPGFFLGISYIVQTAPSDTPLWIEASVRLVGVALIIVAGNAAWHLAKNRVVRFSFTLYALMIIALVIVAAVLVANGGSG